MKKQVLLSLVVLFALALASCAPAATVAAPDTSITAGTPEVETTKNAEENAPAPEENTELTVAAPATAPAAPAAAPTFTGEIKIANLSPLSGPVPTFGTSTTNGFNMAIDEWNAKGGVLGMKIIPDVADSQCTADPAVNAANKVIGQDGVH